MNQKIVKALQHIKDEYGIAIFDNANRVKTLLANFALNEYAEELRLLLLIWNEGFPQKMLQGHSFAEEDLRSHAAAISEKFYLRDNAVMSALLCWENVINAPTQHNSTNTPTSFVTLTTPDGLRYVMYNEVLAYLRQDTPTPGTPADEKKTGVPHLDYSTYVTLEDCMDLGGSYTCPRCNKERLKKSQIKVYTPHALPEGMWSSPQLNRTGFPTWRQVWNYVWI